MRERRAGPPYVDCVYFVLFPGFFPFSFPFAFFFLFCLFSSFLLFFFPFFSLSFSFSGGLVGRRQGNPAMTGYAGPGQDKDIEHSTYVKQPAAAWVAAERQPWTPGRR